MLPAARNAPRPRARRASLVLCLALLTGIVAPVTPVAAANVVPSATVANERLAGADRYATAVAVSQRLFPSGPAPVVYLASGANFPDGLSGSPIAARRGGVMLFAQSNALPAVVEAELARLAPAEVVLLGGPAVLSDAVAARVQAVLPAAAVGRLFGADRYATAAQLSASAFAPGAAPTVLVASGENFPDALAAASAAAVIGAPLLLARAGSLPAATAAELDRLNPGAIVIAGGPGVIGDTVASAMSAYAPVERAWGADR
ncbi:MAG TPA: cell wall-binding repeat-containing protein, partial [Candidatus Limnocylindria bacterium]